jgi:predicted glycosyltransferase
VIVLRTPPTAALYHRVDNPIYADLLDRLGSDPGIHAVVLPRLREQADELRRLALPSVLVPGHAIDGPSLVSASDLVRSAGCSMTREAVALGVPVYTTFQGRMGGVDEKLLREGRLRRLERASDVEIRRRDRSVPRLRRDPQVIVDLILGAVA